MFELVDLKPDVIKIMGIGGCGLNAVQHIFSSYPTLEAELICIDTDVQAIQRLEELHTVKTIQFEPAHIADGYTIMDYRLSIQDRELIKSSIAGTDWLFIIARFGGNTGTIIASTVAKLARKMGAFTVVIPLLSDTSQHIGVATAGINQLTKYANFVITLPKEINPLESPESVNDIILQIVKSISDPITQPGLRCFSPEDLKLVMSKKGEIRVGIGQANGKDRASLAAEAAIVSPWLDGNSICNATGIFINMSTGRSDTSFMSLEEFDTVLNTIHDHLPEDADVVMAISFDSSLLNDTFRVVIFATGFGNCSINHGTHHGS